MHRFRSHIVSSLGHTKMSHYSIFINILTNFHCKGNTDPCKTTDHCTFRKLYVCVSMSHILRSRFHQQKSFQALLGLIRTIDRPPAVCSIIQSVFQEPFIYLIESYRTSAIHSFFCPYVKLFWTLISYMQSMASTNTARHKTKINRPLTILFSRFFN